MGDHENAMRLFENFSKPENREDAVKALSKVNVGVLMTGVHQVLSSNPEHLTHDVKLQIRHRDKQAREMLEEAHPGITKSGCAMKCSPQAQQCAAHGCCLFVIVVAVVLLITCGFADQCNGGK